MKRAKIKIRKIRGMWYALIPGDMPEFASFRHWSDALAKVFFELREGRQ